MDLLKELLLQSWSKETCMPEKTSLWNENSPSLGQSSITSLIVNDIYGGKIIKFMTPTESHYCNLLEDKVVDFTKNQIVRETHELQNWEVIKRENLITDDDTRKRYKELLGKVRCVLLEKGFEEITKKVSLNKYRDYLDQYYPFVDFEIDEYSRDHDYEYTRFTLEAQNTGLVIKVKHDLKSDQYTCSLKEGQEIFPTEFLKSVFDIAREYQENFVLEKKLTEAHVKARFI